MTNEEIDTMIAELAVADNWYNGICVKYENKINSCEECPHSVEYDGEYVCAGDIFGELWRRSSDVNDPNIHITVRLYDDKAIFDMTDLVWKHIRDNLCFNTGSCYTCESFMACKMLPKIIREISNNPLTFDINMV